MNKRANCFFRHRDIPTVLTKYGVCVHCRRFMDKLRYKKPKK